MPDRRKRQKKKIQRPVRATQDYNNLRTLNRNDGGHEEIKMDFHTNGTVVQSYKHDADLNTRLRLYFKHEGSKVAFLFVYYAISLLIAVSRYYKYAAEPKYAITRIVFKKALPFARMAAGLLLFNCAIILFPVCRTLISKLRGSILNTVVPFDKNIVFHKFVGAHIMLYTIIHISAHTFDFRYLSELSSLGLGFAPMGTPESLWLGLLPAYTGHIALLALFLMTTSAMRKVRVSNFEIFYYTHHLYIIFLISMILHGAGCVVESLAGSECVAFTEFWKWSILSMLCYTCERVVFRALLRTSRPVDIQKVIIHPSNVIEIQWIPRYAPQLLDAKPGQYIFLNCPAVGGRQYHPFTLTSCPQEGFMSIHFREAGDFTKRLSKLLIDTAGSMNDGFSIKSMPKIYVDGPFGAAAEDAFKYSACIFVGAGIGVTPFGSLLKSIFYQAEMGTCPVKKVKFFWICRDTTAFEWFNELLHTLEQQDSTIQLEYHIYLSKVRPSMVQDVIYNDVGRRNDPITGLQSKTNYGRPNWDSIFANIASENPTERIGLFACGPKPLTNILKKNCMLYTHYQNSKVQFFFNKENFG